MSATGTAVCAASRRTSTPEELTGPDSGVVAAADATTRSGAAPPTGVRRGRRGTAGSRTDATATSTPHFLLRSP
ncbi:hypothetical protein FRAAL5396 [Frankia alni ACN14a]|uniref:Uncharacterized protein n=1 Tax=Frankia alni (strain DSM 45986 / CECT 9034 / ACN14a) TaxID=326424 RepID=Q0RES7_FRAAA|nr:hypothetical protein FRAAL5396 [Frankia alni ACN14a]